MVDIAIAALSAVGVVLSGFLAFTGGAYLGADARLFGLPNTVCGLLFYGVLFVLALNHEVLADVMGFLVLVGAFAVMVSIYLTFRLLVSLRARCSLCLAAHVVNLFLLVVFLVGL